MGRRYKYYLTVFGRQVATMALKLREAVIESGHLSHYRWDEYTQIYFRHGWIKTWAPPLLLKQVPAEVEIYRAG